MERIEVTESGDRDLDKNAENPGQGWENLSRETEEPNWGIVDEMEAQLEGEASMRSFRRRLPIHMWWFMSS